MNYSLLAKVAIAGAVLTGVTNTVIVGNIAGVNHEAKAQVAQPNAGHFHKTVDGKELDFTDVFTKKSLTPKELGEKVKSELENAGLEASNYSFRIEVKTSGGATIQGGGKVTEVPNNATSTFDPTKDTLDKFEIYKS